MQTYEYIYIYSNVMLCVCVRITLYEMLNNVIAYGLCMLNYSNNFWNDIEKKNYRCFGFEIVVSALKKPGYYIYG
jgi:chemotaxis receptor (MCP) glutamine deamidase CheD